MLLIFVSLTVAWSRTNGCSSNCAAVGRADGSRCRQSFRKSFPSSEKWSGIGGISLLLPILNIAATWFNSKISNMIQVSARKKRLHQNLDEECMISSNDFCNQRPWLSTNRGHPFGKSTGNLYHCSADYQNGLWRTCLKSLPDCKIVAMQVLPIWCSIWTMACFPPLLAICWMRHSKGLNCLNRQTLGHFISRWCPLDLMV